MKLSKSYAVALTAALGLFMAVLDNTIVNVALTPMADKLGANLSSIQWVVTGYFLAQAAVIPPAGYFSNRFGIKRMFMLCLAFFTLGSLLCGLAQSAEMLIIFRVIQGLGGGALFPIGQSIAFSAFPPQERAASSAVIGIPVLLAPVFGPTVGGLLTVNFGWEVIFFINVPVGLLALYLAWRVIPADTKQAAGDKAGFDIGGLLLSITGVVLIVYGFALVSEPIAGTQTALNPRGELNGWGYWLVWTLVGLGVAVLAFFAYYETKVVKDPVLDLRLFRQYNFLIGSAISWVAAVVVFGSMFLLPVFLEQVRSPHLTALDAGLALMPQGIAAAIAIALGGKLYNTLGVRTLALIGTTLLIGSSFAMTYLQPSTDGFWLMPWLIIRGFGFGFTAIPMQTLAIQTVTGPALPKAMSLFNTTRQVASSIGIAVLATLFAQQASQHVRELTGNIPQTGAAPGASGGQAMRDQLFAQAGTSAMNDVFLFVTVGTVIMLLLSFALPGKPRTAESGATEKESSRPMVMAE